ncbi:MAG: endonuclease I family protein, partial [Planctomycetia bacterium]
MTTPLVADAPAGYYNSVNATSSSTLRTTLHALIDDHTRIPYTATTTDTWNVLELADQNAGNTSQILDVYKNASYTKVGAGNTNYNREHTWPSSYGFPNDGTTNYPYTDCHHLFLVDDSYNSSRGNNPYRNCPTGCSELVTLVNNGEGGGSGIYPGNSNWRTGAGATGTWETWNDRRGDVARALMYMDVRYEGGTHGITGAAEPNLILTDNESLIASSSTGSNVSTAYMGMLSVLLVWHAQDPVDAKEMARNDAVFQYQGNRNPFIDHPEWAQCLFSNSCVPTADT